MKNRSFISFKNKGFNGQFSNLSNNDMINLRGGDNPPPRPSHDYPLNPPKYSLMLTTYTATQPILVQIA